MNAHNEDGGPDIKAALDKYEALRQEAARALLVPVVDKSVRTDNTQVPAKLVKGGNTLFGAIKDFFEAGSQIVGDSDYLRTKYRAMEIAYGVSHSWDRSTGKLDLRLELANAMSDQMGIQEEHAFLREKYGMEGNTPRVVSSGVTIEKLDVSDRNIDFGAIDLPKPLINRYKAKQAEQQASAPPLPPQR